MTIATDFLGASGTSPPRRTLLTPSQRSTQARAAAFARHSRTSGAEATAPMRAGFMRRFELAVDPDGVLSEGERQRRAALARRSHMLSLAAKSARARAKRGGR